MAHQARRPDWTKGSSSVCSTSGRAAASRIRPMKQLSGCKSAGSKASGLRRAHDPICQLQLTERHIPWLPNQKRIRHRLRQSHNILEAPGFLVRQARQSHLYTPHPVRASKVCTDPGLTSIGLSTSGRNVRSKAANILASCTSRRKGTRNTCGSAATGILDPRRAQGYLSLVLFVN